MCVEEISKENQKNIYYLIRYIIYIFHKTKQNKNKQEGNK